MCFLRGAFCWVCGADPGRREGPILTDLSGNLRRLSHGNPTRCSATQRPTSLARGTVHRGDNPVGIECGVTRTVCGPTVTASAAWRLGRISVFTRWGRPLSSFIWRSFRPITFRSAAAAPGRDLLADSWRLTMLLSPTTATAAAAETARSPTVPARVRRGASKVTDGCSSGVGAQGRGQAGDVRRVRLAVGAALECASSSNFLELGELPVETERNPLRRARALVRWDPVPHRFLRRSLGADG